MHRLWRPNIIHTRSHNVTKSETERTHAHDINEDGCEWADAGQMMFDLPRI